MINDKTYRLALAERYLNAETSVREEAELAAYYAAHEAEADEQDVARLLTMCLHEEGALMDQSAAEFDHIIEQGKKRRKRTWLWTSSIAAVAASIALMFAPGTPQPAGQDTSAIDLIQSLINQKEVGCVKKVETEKIGEMLFLTLTLDSGQQFHYIMVTDKSDGTLCYIPATKKE